MKITFEFATQDDCLDRMVPSDLRVLVAQREWLHSSRLLTQYARAHGGAAEFFDVGKAESWSQAKAEIEELDRQARAEGLIK